MDFFDEAMEELNRIDGTVVPVFVDVIDEPPDDWKPGQPVVARFIKTRKELRWIKRR